MYKLVVLSCPCPGSSWSFEQLVSAPFVQRLALCCWTFPESLVIFIIIAHRIEARMWTQLDHQRSRCGYKAPMGRNNVRICGLARRAGWRSSKLCEGNPGDVDSISEWVIWTAQLKKNIPKTKPVIHLVQRNTVTAPSGQVKARVTTRGYEQALHGNEGCYFGTPFDHVSQGFAGVGGEVGPRG